MSTDRRVRPPLVRARVAAVRSQPAFLAVAIVFLLLLVAWTIFDPAYETNDDVAMRLMVEGRFVPGMAPTGFTLFMNVLVGKVLVAAVTAWPALPWYDIALGSLTVAALVVLLYATLDPAPALGWLFVVAVAVHLLLPILVRWQFTHTATAAAAAGVSLLARAALLDLPRGRTRVHLGVGIALFAAGSLVRLEAAVLVALVGVLLALPLVWPHLHDPAGRGRVGVAALALASSLVLAGALFAVDYSIYARDPAWHESREYNGLLRFLEYIPQDAITPAALAALQSEVGWSEVDLMMLRRRFFVDFEVFSRERLRAAARVIAPLRNPFRVVRPEGVGAAAGLLVERTSMTLLLLAAMALLRPSTRLLLYILYSTAIFVLMVSLIQVTLKSVPHRVYWGLLILVAMFLGAAGRSWGRPARPGAALLSAFALLAGVGFGTRTLVTTAATSHAASEAVRGDLARFPRLGDVTLMIEGATFPYEAYWRPLRRSSPLDLVSLSAGTPPVRDFLRRTGREDLLLSLCSERRLLLVARLKVMPLVAAFLREHHGIEVAFKPKFRGKSFTAYRCTVVN